MNENVKAEILVRSGWDLITLNAGKCGKLVEEINEKFRTALNRC